MHVTADIDVRQRSDSTPHLRLALTLLAHVLVLRTTPRFARLRQCISYIRVHCLRFALRKGLIHGAIAPFIKFFLRKKQNRGEFAAANMRLLRNQMCFAIVFLRELLRCFTTRFLQTNL